MKLDVCEILLGLTNHEFLENISFFSEYNLMQPEMSSWIGDDKQASKLEMVLNKLKVKVEDIYVALSNGDDTDDGDDCDEQPLVVSLNEFLSFDDYDDFNHIVIGIGQPYKNVLFETELLSFMRA